jgi:DivIVA domain-containing protein
MRRLLSLLARLHRRPAPRNRADRHHDHGRNGRSHHDHHDRHAITPSTRSPNAGRYPDVGRYHLTGLPGLSAAQVRERQFHLVRRHGLDPDEVQAFLHRVAAELAAARRELAYTREENDRVKRALRSWQSHAHGRVHR